LHRVQSDPGSRRSLQTLEAARERRTDDVGSGNDVTHDDDGVNVDFADGKILSGDLVCSFASSLLLIFKVGG
jgi:hypothetical protein